MLLLKNRPQNQPSQLLCLGLSFSNSEDNNCLIWGLYVKDERGTRQLHGLYSPWNSPGHNTRVGSLSLLQGELPNPGIEPKSLALQVDSLPAEPQGKPKNTGAGSLSLPQWIFLTQESNQGLLHCRQILYQLSYQGSLVATDQTRNDHCYSCYWERI